MNPDIPRFHSEDEILSVFRDFMGKVDVALLSGAVIPVGIRAVCDTAIEHLTEMRALAQRAIDMDWKGYESDKEGLGWKP